ncbi:MAG: SDR family NAD(P)-dependent oxidoreductase [Prosthecobacter sp.]|uniref:SDR family NAD(P)-dependent oxidoreductase n=1 Tax=Prosthecobacter sp. TaxID=1965333 RepID=UPI0039039A8C
MVLVTGGANGIGSTIARSFPTKQAHVCFCDTDASAGQALAKEPRPLGRRGVVASHRLTALTPSGQPAAGCRAPLGSNK